jgi:hypothetical protein
LGATILPTKVQHGAVELKAVDKEVAVKVELPSEPMTEGLNWATTVFQGLLF